MLNTPFSGFRSQEGKAPVVEPALESRTGENQSQGNSLQKFGDAGGRRAGLEGARFGLLDLGAGGRGRK